MDVHHLLIYCLTWLQDSVAGLCKVTARRNDLVSVQEQEPKVSYLCKGLIAQARLQLKILKSSPDER